MAEITMMRARRRDQAPPSLQSRGGGFTLKPVGPRRPSARGRPYWDSSAPLPDCGTFGSTSSARLAPAPRVSRDSKP